MVHLLSSILPCFISGNGGPSDGIAQSPKILDSGTPYSPFNPIGNEDLLPPSYSRIGDPVSGHGHSTLLGPKDPSWFGRIEAGPNFGGRQDIGIPPGARFDPYGPPGVPGFEPDRFSRNQRRGPGSGIHPDLQHLGGGNDFI